MVVLGVVAVLAVVAAVLAATRSAPRYDPATPTGVVQGYVSALVDGDRAQAVRFLVPDSPCALADLDRADVPDQVRVVLNDSDVVGGTARVEVEVVTSSSDPFGGYEFSERHTFRLTRDGGDWRIAGEPWPMYGCGEGL